MDDRHGTIALLYYSICVLLLGGTLILPKHIGYDSACKKDFLGSFDPPSHLSLFLSFSYHIIKINHGRKQARLYGGY